MPVAEWANDPELQRVLEMLLPTKDRSLAQSVLFVGLITQNTTWVNLGLEKGADPNFSYKEKGSETPLMMAAFDASDHSKGIIRALLDAGADPNLPVPLYDSTRTPLVAICAKYDDGSIASLLDHSKMPLDLLARDGSGLTPALEVASNPKVTHVTLQALQSLYEEQIWNNGQAKPGEVGFDLPRNHLWVTPVVQGTNGSNALFIAHLSGNSLDWLLRHPDLGMKKHLEDRDEHNETVLMRMVQFDAWPAIECLLSHGAVIHDPNSELPSALTTAREAAKSSPSRQPILDLLLGHLAAKEAREAMDRTLAVDGAHLAKP